MLVTDMIVYLFVTENTVLKIYGVCSFFTDLTGLTGECLEC